MKEYFYLKTQYEERVGCGSSVDEVKNNSMKQPLSTECSLPFGLKCRLKFTMKKKSASYGGGCFQNYASHHQNLFNALMSASAEEKPITAAQI